MLTRFALTAIAILAPSVAHALTPVAHVETKGHGATTMVLVPGWACDWTVWDAFMDRNADHYTMHALTLPGFGGTASPPLDPEAKGTPWIDNAAHAVGAFLDSKNLTDVVLVGHSMGGHLAYRVAIEHPDRVAKVISIDGFPAFPIGGPKSQFTPEQRTTLVDSMLAPRMRELTDEQWGGQQKTMLNSMVTDPSRAAQLAAVCATTDKQTAIEYYLQLLKSDVTPRMPELKQPTLAIAAIDPSMNVTGQADNMRIIWRQQVESAPNAKLVFFEATRHFVMDDQPDALDETVSNFLAGKPVQDVATPPAPVIVAPATDAAPAAPAAKDKPEVEPKPQ
ncbi:MAG: alpha/beta fold hydrolase [Phycisphaerales bacterium]